MTTQSPQIKFLPRKGDRFWMTSSSEVVKMEHEPSIFGDKCKLEIEDGSLVQKPLTIFDLGKNLLISAREGNMKSVTEILARGAPFSTDWLGMSPLHFAAMNNHFKVCNVLIMHGVSLDAKTKVDRTPLHLAVYEGHLRIVSLLLKCGCDVDSMDMLFMTPLHWAVEKRNLLIVELLLSHGANPRALSKFGKTPISIAIQRQFLDVLDLLNKAKLLKKADSEQLKQATNSIVMEMQNRSSPELCEIMEESNSEPIEEFQRVEDNAQEEEENEELLDEDMNIQDNEDMSLSDAITRLGCVEDMKHVDMSVMQILKQHGISFLPTEDTENTLITNALQSGRKIILSEVGKRIFNQTMPKQMMNFGGDSPVRLNKDANNSTTKKEDDQQKQRSTVLTKIMKKQVNDVNNGTSNSAKMRDQSMKVNKIVKVVSPDELNRILGTSNKFNGKNVTIQKMSGKTQTKPVRSQPNNGSHNHNLVFGDHNSNSVKNNFVKIEKVIEMEPVPTIGSQDSMKNKTHPIVNKSSNVHVISVKTQKLGTLEKDIPLEGRVDVTDELVNANSDEESTSSNIRLQRIEEQIEKLVKQNCDLRTKLEFSQRLIEQNKRKIEVLEQREGIKKRRCSL